ncbi:hypothetical protein ONZ45_g5389 [Pleurotus djamor]|nr:hypothetical protein ONZ45_g5389 [Pleurotus djamor]
MSTPSTLQPQAWSPNTWRTRYSLNYKGLAYKTIWVEYPDIESLCKKIGAEPTSKKADGRPHYTLPVIHDQTTGTVVSDGAAIAEYLDKQYPDTPKLFPEGTAALQHGFIAAYFNNIAALFQFSLPQTNSILLPRSEAYFRSTREQAYQTTMEKLVPSGEKRDIEWGKYRDGLGKVDSWISKSRGTFAMGDTITFADISVASFIIWLRVIWGEDSEQWKDIKSWHNGRWERLLDGLSKYAATD